VPALVSARARNRFRSAQKEKTRRGKRAMQAAPYRRCIVHSVSTNIAVLPGGVRRLTLICL